ncbi:MAG: hypothetical protein JNM61_09475 [Zoogloeaceae bacterium]|nr:hypothetical protein [Zoogloeaceae bacterium]
MAESDDKRPVDSLTAGYNPERERIDEFDSATYRLDSPLQREARNSLNLQLEDAGHVAPEDRYSDALGMVASAEPTSLRKRTLRAGEHVYAFTSRPADGTSIGKSQDSVYYIPQDEYHKVIESCQTDGKLDRDKVKSHLALPCWNACDQVVMREVKQDVEVWESTCAATTERVRDFDADGNEYVYQRSMKGGGTQIFCLCAKDTRSAEEKAAGKEIEDPNYGVMKEVRHGKELTPYRDDRAAVEEAARKAEAEKKADSQREHQDDHALGNDK